MATPDLAQLLIDFDRQHDRDDPRYLEEWCRFMRAHRKEFDFGVDLEDTDEELVQANSEADIQTERQEQELATDEAWSTALETKKCRVCNNFEPRAHPSSLLFQFGSRLISFLEIQHLQSNWDFARTKGSQKCGYCDLIVRTVFRLVLNTDEAKNIRMFRFESLTLVEHQPALLTVRLLLSSGWESRGIEIFRSLDDNFHELPVLGAASSIPQNSGSDETMNFVQDCLDTCIKNHGSCQLVDPPLPKRVLFFEANTLSDAPFLVHLYIPKRLDRQPYAALSHCWGSKEDQMHILKAEKENLTTLESSIPWNRLSKTFQDGITVASKLGLQYIWIDSLCIIQDDKDDWIIEAAKMGEIYQNAYVTIAAASSPSNRVRFLKDRSSFSHPVPVKFYGPQKASVPRRILAQIGIAKPKTLYARQTSRTASNEHMIAGWTRTRAFDSQIAGPLSSRAWTFQERALSTRIVHFSDEGVVYECLQKARRESSMSSFPSILSRWEQFKPISSLQEKDAVKMRNKLQIFWREVLINYTARYITFRTDILPALSSTAARMHSLIESPYLAGLWQDRFVEDLCWRPVVGLSDKVPLLDPDDLLMNMPTWSCFSINHPIGFAVTDNEGIFVPHCAFVRSDFDSKSRNPSFASLEGRKVIIEGRMRETEVMYPGQWKDAHAMSAYLNGPSPLHNSVVQDAPWIEDVAVSAGGGQLKTIRRALEGETLDYIRASCFCLDIGRWIPARIPHAMEGVEHWFILVLAPSTKVDGAYERLGMMDSGVPFSRSCQEEAFGNLSVQRITIV